MGAMLAPFYEGRWMMPKRILTGDRPTGPLHLGHYVGSLANRVKLQHDYETFIMIADAQALTTHFEHPEMLAANVRQVALDYLSLGIDPAVSTIFIQSMIPEIAELAMYYGMFVTVSSLRHNPTIKSEAAEYGYVGRLSYGFLGYPISQAADITFCKANLVPVGPEQVPHIELTRKIVRRFNSLYRSVLVEPEALVGPLLIGLDGKAKMSKNLENCLYLTESPETVRTKILGMYTDPTRVHATDPGHVEQNPVFLYHDAFNPDEDEIADLKERYRHGKVGDVEVKEKLIRVINRLLDPIRERRAYYAGRPALLDEVLRDGTRHARQIARATLEEVREAMGMRYFPERVITTDASRDYA